MTNILLSSLFIVNVILGILWYLRKMQTLEYKVHKFIKGEKAIPPPFKSAKEISEDAIIQIFLRCGNEDLRPMFKLDQYKQNALILIQKYLKLTVSGKYLVNTEALFNTRVAPTAPPISKDDDLIIL